MRHWGPTVANRVPVHASGPYRVAARPRRARAPIHTNDPAAGAFRGFGVPQAAIAQETLIDELAERLGIDPLEFRILNALRDGDATATGQVLGAAPASALPRGAAARVGGDARGGRGRSTQPARSERRGVGVAGMWYGCGNTSLPNPSTMPRRP